MPVFNNFGLNKLVLLTAEDMAKAIKDTRSEIKNILSQHSVERSSLIPVLQDIQAKFGYLAVDAVQELENLTDISANEIYGVATFYAQFRFSPPGEHTIQVCLGTACHVRGGRQILREIEQRLKITAGQVTKDGKFDLQRVACLGCCALAPVVTVDGKVHAQMTTKKVPELLAKYSDRKAQNRK
jgi:NADH-quinone oxidoreductase subunit E